MGKSQIKARRIRKHLKKKRFHKQTQKERKKTMKQIKKWYKKPATIKVIITLIALILSAFGLTMTEESQNKLTNAIVEVQSVVDQVDASND